VLGTVVEKMQREFDLDDRNSADPAERGLIFAS
jgi:hypothetical protein